MSETGPNAFSAAVESATTPGGKPAAIVACEGDLDLAGVDRFEEAIESANAGDGMVVDLAGVGFIDSSGIHALVKTRTARAGEGGLEVVVAPDSAVERVLEMSGLRDELHPRADRDAALAGLDDGGASGEPPAP